MWLKAGFSAGKLFFPLVQATKVGGPYCLQDLSDKEQNI